MDSQVVEGMGVLGREGCAGWKDPALVGASHVTAPGDGASGSTGKSDPCLGHGLSADGQPGPGAALLGGEAAVSEIAGGQAQGAVQGGAGHGSAGPAGSDGGKGGGDRRKPRNRDAQKSFRMRQKQRIADLGSEIRRLEEK
ncbi:unnamed protein product, partial [Ostreobium quekettii]|eukprot:evm.model.scf_1931.1 EVM.evm.TU.scf_1931.1   scf_1931:9535-10458(-)